MKINRAALIESISDTVIGMSINFPMNTVLLYVAVRAEMTVLQTSVFMTIIFTIFAIVRKYILRLHFSKKNKR